MKEPLQAEMQQDELPEVVQSHGQGVLSMSNEATTNALMARELGLIQAQMSMARQYPRDEYRSLEKLRKTCQRRAFAEEAIYARPQGRKKDENGNWVDNVITGPSVKLARVIAQRWGNLFVMFNIQPTDPGWVQLSARVIDLETNTMQEHSDRFRARIFRKATKATRYKPAQPDRWIELFDTEEGLADGELRSLMNRKFAFCERAAILKVIPRDIVDELMAEARATMRKDAEEIAKNPELLKTRIVKGFSAYGVSVDMIQGWANCSIDDLSPDQIQQLLEIGTSLKDGHSVREDHFVVPGAQTPAQKAMEEAAAKAKRAQKEESENE